MTARLPRPPRPRSPGTIVPQTLSPPHRHPIPRRAIIASHRPPRAPRGLLRRRQVRSEIATESRVPRTSPSPSRRQPTTPSGTLCPPPRPTGRRVPPGTWVRRTLTYNGGGCQPPFCHNTRLLRYFQCVDARVSSGNRPQVSREDP